MVPEMDFAELKTACLSCDKCALCKGRTHVVVGVGNEAADVMFIGEGPGEQEDLKGEPFVGRAGQLLDRMMNAVGLDRRHNAYIANMVKCRPPHNRDPLPEEQEACLDWLRRQTALIKPRIIVCLGRIAACRLIDPDMKISRQHGQWVQKNGTWMTAMLHPAAILRNPAQKPEAFADFLRLRDKMVELGLEEQLTFPNDNE